MCGYNEDINTLVNQNHQMKKDLAYFTECQLATLEGMKLVRKTAKHELQRQQSIVDKMVLACRQHGVDKMERWTGPGSCSRIWEIFDGRRTG